MSQQSLPGMGGGGGGGVSVTEVAAAVTLDTSAAETKASELGQLIVKSGEEAAGPGAAGYTQWGQRVASAASTGLIAIRSMSTAFGSTSPFGPLVASLASVQAGLQLMGQEIDKDATKMEHLQVTGMKLVGVGAAVAGLGAAFTAIAQPIEAANAALTTAIANTNDKLTGAANSVSDFKSKIDEAGASGAKYGFNIAEINNALAKLTVQTKDPTEALKEMTFAETLARAAHMSLTDAASQLGRMHAGLFRSLRQFGIQLPNVTNAAKELAKAEKDLQSATDKLNVANQVMADFEAKVHDAMTKRTEAWAQKVENANIAAANASTNYQNALQKQSDAAQTAIQKQIDAETVAVQKVQDAKDKLKEIEDAYAQTSADDADKIASAQQHLDDIKQQYADTDAQRLQQHSEAVEQATQTEQNAAQHLADTQESIALRPARTGAEQFANMVRLRDAQRAVTQAKEKEADAANKALVTSAEAERRNTSLVKAQEAIDKAIESQTKHQDAYMDSVAKANEAIAKSQRDQTKAQEASAKAQEASARATERAAAAFQKMGEAQEKAQQTQAGAAVAGQMTPAEKAQEDRIQRSIDREKKAIDKANQMKADAQSQDAKLQAAFEDAQNKFMEREKGLLDRRSKTWSGHVAGIKAQIENLFMHMSKFAPLLTGIGGAIMGVGGIVNMAGHIGKAVDKLKNLGTVAGETEKLAGEAGSLGKIGKSGEQLALNFGKNEGKISGIFSKLSGGAGAMKGGIGSAISGLMPIFEGLGGLLLGPVGIAIGIIAGLAAIGYVIYRNWDTIKRLLGEVWHAIFGVVKDVFGAVEGFFKKWWDKLLLLPPFTLLGIGVQIAKHWKEISGFITGVFDDVVDFFKKWWDKILLIPPFTMIGIGVQIAKHWGEITKAITGIFDDLVKWFEGLGDKIWKALGDLWTKFKSGGANIMHGIWSGVSDVAVGFFNFVKDIPGKIWDTLGDLWTKFKDAGKNIVNGIWRGISDTWDSFVGWVEKAFKNSFVGKVLSWLGITSPSSVFAGIGKNVVLGLQQGIVGNTGLVEDAAKKLADTTKFTPTQLTPFNAAGGSSRPGGGVYAGVGAQQQGQGQNIYNFTFTMPIAGSVIAQRDLEDQIRTFIQRGAQSSGGLSRFFSTTP